MSDIGTYAESLYQQVQPLHGPDPDGLAHDYVGAVAHPFREVDEIVRDTPEGVGWSVIVDVDAAPIKGLWWLAQLAGVKLRRKRMARESNLIEQPSFEGLISNFALNGGTGDGSGGVVDGGTHGTKMLRMTSVTNGDIWFAHITPIAVVPGKEYTVSVDVVQSAKPTHLTIQWHDSTPALISTHVGPSVTGAPNRLHLTSVAPVDVAWIVILVYMEGAAIGEKFAIDAVALRRTEEDDHPEEYVDGDMQGGVWEGTAHDSPSYVYRRIETDEEWAAYARDAIKRQGGKQRGTVDAILSAAEDTLIGQRRARIRERVGGNAWALQLITRPSETPDPDLTYASALTQKPAGMTLEHILTEGLLIDEDTGGTIDTAGGTIDTPTD